MFKAKQPYLIMDLDGTIIETKSGKAFPENKDDWKFREGVLDAIEIYCHNHYFELAIITNQGGIEKGFVDPKEFNEKCIAIVDQICTHLDEVMDIPVFIAPSMSHPGRKPNPYFAYKLRDEFNCDLSRSLYVGDASGLVRKTRAVPFEYAQELEEKCKGDLSFTLKVNKHTSYVIEKSENEYNFFTYKKDFSDSDKMFAKNSGIPYMDIEEFLKEHEIK